MVRVFGYIVALCQLMVTMTVTAASYQRTDAGMGFAWQTANAIGVYTTGGTILKYTATALGNPASTASFSCGFGLVEGARYFAYSPYDKNNYNKPSTAIPVSYAGQTQTGNDNADHLSAYDFQMGTFIPTSSANVSFVRVGAVIDFCWKVDKTDASVANISLSVTDGSEPFITAATMNLQMLTDAAVAKSDIVSLNLKNVTLSEDERLRAYLILHEVDLTGKVLNATLTMSDGTSYTERISGTALLRGNIYPISIGEDVTPTEGAESKPYNAKLVTESNAAEAGAAIATLTATARDFMTDSEHVLAVRPIVRGDVNDDGVIDIIDAVTLNGYYLNNMTEELDPRFCDVNEDDVIDILDVIEIKSIYLNAK